MRKLLAILLLFPSLALAGEKQTTWRVGDEIYLGAFCMTAEDAVIVAEGTLEEARVPFREKRCHVVDEDFSRAAGKRPLQQFISHHFDPVYKKRLSVWKVADVYLALEDDKGPHEVEEKAT